MTVRCTRSRMRYGSPSDPVMTPWWASSGRRWALALMHRQKAAERDRGQKLGAEVGEVLRNQGRNLCDLPIIEVYLARERARAGDRDDAIALMRSTVDHLFRTGRLLLWGVPATGVLVETLLDRAGRR